MSDRTGPLESRPWPKTLEATAVEPGPAPRLHGYAVDDDLARHYRFSDVLWLSLMGELPSPPVGALFERLLVALLPLSVAESPVHAATLAASCGARPSGVLAVSGLALAEHAAETLAAVLPNISGRSVVLAAEHRASSQEERRFVEELEEHVRRAVGADEVPAVFAQEPSRDVALLAALWACGIRRPSTLELVMAYARLPSALAEAGPREPLDFPRYPTVDAPPFVYEAP